MASRDPSNNNVLETTVPRVPGAIAVRPYRDTDYISTSRHGNSKAVWNNLRNRMPHPYTEEHAKSWAEQCMDPSDFVKSGPWTAETGGQGPATPTHYVITVNDEAVGSIALEFCDPKNIYARSAELGYWLGEEYWGKGVMRAVVPVFTQWAWRTFGMLIRLDSPVHEKNAASRKCLERAGFVYEGTRRRAIVKNGVVADEIMLGMVRPGGVEGNAVDEK